MTEVQATLHQLQSGRAVVSGDAPADSNYIHTVELGIVSPVRRWLRLSALLTFVMGFLSHQYYLLALLADDDHQNSVSHVVQPKGDSAELVADTVIAREQQSPEQATMTLLSNTQQEADDPFGGVPTNNVLLNAEAVKIQVAQERQLNAMKQKQLDLLYSNASTALSKDRLTTPASDNALHYFQSMLDIDSTEPRALIGLQAVAMRYKTFAIKLAKKGDISGAAEMLGKAESVTPQILGLGDLIAEMPSVIPNPAVATIDVNSSDSNVSSNQDVSAINLVSSRESSSVSRSVSGKLDDAKFLAKKYIAAGQARDAALLLSEFMPQSATDGELVELLHQAYLNSNQGAEASNLRLTLQGALPSHYLAKMQAAEFLQAGRPVDAITVLEKNLPSYAQDSSYYGLLAGLYYRVQRYVDAEQAYEKLLGVAPETGSYWLGYAVALDAQSNKKALGAFKKARMTLPSQDAARQYVEQRVRELGGVN